MTKVLVITGASKGIGRATARLFRDNGYKVINLSRSPLELEGCQSIAVDMTDIGWPARVATEIEVAVSGAESICVIHNAAVLEKDVFSSIAVESFQRVMQLNVIAPVQLNQILLPHMGKGSSIIYVGSTLSEKAVPGSCSYVTSKHALVGLMRSTCQDLAGTGIHTSCVCPGFTDTEMLRAHVGEDQDILDSIASGVTHGRLIRPEEIAETLWLAAQNPVINGAVLHANLGQIES